MAATVASSALVIPPDTSELNAHSDLGLGMIGNCAISALIDRKGSINWACFPRFDGDPIFCNLLRRTKDLGFFDIVMENCVSTSQEYLKKTPILRTVLTSRVNNELEIIDFCPRFRSHNRIYRPTMIVRIINPIKGRPRIRIRLRPTFGYGWGTPEKTRGSNHLRFMLPTTTVRLTSNAPIAYIADEVLFEIDEPIYLVLMPDESLTTSLQELALANLESTKAYWHEYVRTIAIPFEFQPEVIRASITLALNTYEETGAIIAAPTTSIPFHAAAGRHDYRYCWLRDSHQIIVTLTSLGATSTMEPFLRYLSNIVANVYDNAEVLQAVYGLALETRLHPREMHRLAGYRSIGPVCVGTDDYQKESHDAYGAVILALAHAFFDERLTRSGDEVLFRRLEQIGKEILKRFDKPDAGPVGVPNEQFKVHTFSVVTCWAACQRLGRIATKLGIPASARSWETSADDIQRYILETCFNKELNSFVSTRGEKTVDAFLLFLPELGFLSVDDPRFQGTLALIEKTLRVGDYLLRSPDDLNAAVPATLWYISTLARIESRKAEARELFVKLLSRANGLGLLSESMNPTTHEMWGNFPQSTAMVGIMHAAVRLSRPWTDAV